MIEDENEDRRQELCERFRKSLTKPVGERFFDEDELIDLFDFAGDMADDYLKMEVLMCGARLYPESALLKERRAIFYSFVSDDAASKFLEDNPQENSPMWEIMRLRSRAPHGKDAERALEYLLGGVDKLDDEEVIQFVELASQLGAYDWLVANEKQLRRQSEYAPILIYEMAVVSELNHNYEKAVAYLEELTEAEPFNAYYWYMLAQDFDMLDKRDRAMAALDYSLAIDPDGKEALQMRARMLIGDEKTQDEAAEIIRTLAGKYPDDADVQRVAAFVNYATGNVAASREAMRNCLDRFPGDRAVLSDAFATGVGDLSFMLDRFFNATDERDEDTWLDWAEELRGSGMYNEARQVIEAYERNSTTPLLDRSVYLDVLFRLQDFETINRLVESEKDGSILDSGSWYANIIICLISKIKTGKLIEARRFAEDMLRDGFTAADGTDDLLARISAHAIFSEINGILRSGRSFDWFAFDPFGIWPDKE